jgi:hypothetical protein
VSSHVVCNTCVEGLRHWYQGTRLSMPFGIPMVWREPQNHYDDCYFCLCNVSGCKKRNKVGIKHPNLSSAIRPVPHGPDDTIPAPPAQLEDVESSCSSESTVNDDVDFSPDDEDRTPQIFYPNRVEQFSTGLRPH